MELYGESIISAGTTKDVPQMYLIFLKICTGLQFAMEYFQESENNEDDSRATVTHICQETDFVQCSILQNCDDLMNT